MNGPEALDKKRIHIDREPFESPSPTTGEALYALGDIPEHQKLANSDASRTLFPI